MDLREEKKGECDIILFQSNRHLKIIRKDENIKSILNIANLYIFNIFLKF